jgi:hypothetical protein
MKPALRPALAATPLKAEANQPPNGKGDYSHSLAEVIIDRPGLRADNAMVSQR